jgi:hypothetical protein
MVRTHATMNHQPHNYRLIITDHGIQTGQGSNLGSRHVMDDRETALLENIMICLFFKLKKKHWDNESTDSQVNQII